MVTAAVPERKVARRRFRPGMQAVRMARLSMIWDQIEGVAACQVGSGGVAEKKGSMAVRLRIVKTGTLCCSICLVNCVGLGDGG